MEYGNNTFNYFFVGITNTNQNYLYHQYNQYHLYNHEYQTFYI